MKKQAALEAIREIRTSIAHSTFAHESQGRYENWANTWIMPRLNELEALVKGVDREEINPTYIKAVYGEVAKLVVVK